MLTKRMNGRKNMDMDEWRSMSDEVSRFCVTKELNEEQRKKRAAAAHLYFVYGVLACINSILVKLLL